MTMEDRETAEDTGVTNLEVTHKQVVMAVNTTAEVDHLTSAMQNRCYILSRGAF